eukprot:4442500-Pleurochrysis_carterae.AAC.2
MRWKTERPKPRLRFRDIKASAERTPSERGMHARGRKREFSENKETGKPGRGGGGKVHGLISTAQLLRKMKDSSP